MKYSALALVWLLAGCGASPLTSSAVAPSPLNAVGLDSPWTTLSTRAKPVWNKQHQIIGLDGVTVGRTIVRVAFSGGGMAYQYVSTTSYPDLASAQAVLSAITVALNTRPSVTAADASWAPLDNHVSQGDILLPYAVNWPDSIPYVYASWDAGVQAWMYHGTFVKGNMDPVAGSATWANVTP